jgi:hypothetical protein
MTDRSICIDGVGAARSTYGGTLKTELLPLLINKQASLKLSPVK